MNSKYSPSPCRFLAPLITTIFLAFTLTSCREQRGFDDEFIYIGEVASLTGSEATFGTNSDRGLKLYVEQVNARGGIRWGEKSLRIKV